MHHRSRAAALATVTILTIAALAGCATAQADPTSTQQASVTPSPSPTASETPAAAVNVPTQPGTWLIDFDSFAGVRVGEAIAPFAQSAGLAPQEDTVDCPPGFSYTHSIDGEQDNILSASFMEAESRGTANPSPTLTLGMVSSRHSSGHVQPDSPRTAAGIQVGSTEAALLSAYPDLQKGMSKYDDSVGATTYFLGPQNGRYLVFNVRPTPDGSATTVNTIQTSSYPSIVDVCD